MAHRPSAVGEALADEMPREAVAVLRRSVGNGVGPGSFHSLTVTDGS